MLDRFGDIANRLARNPLGIIALFIVLVYGMVSIVTTANGLSENHRTILILFLVFFPVIVLIVFYVLVTRHPEKLYAPTDYKDERLYLDALRIPSEADLEKKALFTANEAIQSRKTIESIVKSDTTDMQLVSLQYISRWNSADKRNVIRRLRKYKVSDVWDKLEVRSDLLEIFNFWEEMAIAIDRNGADEDILREMFSGTVVNMWKHFASWVEERRSKSSMPDLYCNLENLSKKWSAPNHTNSADA